MKIATSFYCVKDTLGSEFEKLWNDFLSERPDEGADTTVWHWNLVVSETAQFPKSWAGLRKSDQKTYLMTGIDRQFLRLTISIKPTKGKVWQSSIFRTPVAPQEVVAAIAKKERSSQGMAGSKWGGKIIEIYTPLHQKHPGLAEHAVVGAFFSGGRCFALLSDRAAPMTVPAWHPYELLPAKRLAVPQLVIFEKAHQRTFLDALPGETVDFGQLNGVKMSDEEIDGFLRGVAKFAWSSSSTGEAPVIHKNARKFKLGEEISQQERKLTPADTLKAALEMLGGK